MAEPHAPADDLQFIFTRLAPLFEGLRGSRIFLTGGTGFIGRWLLESLLDAETRLGLGLTLTVLTRDPEAFRLKAPHLATHAAVRLLAGDVRDFRADGLRADWLIHGATDASAALNAENGLLMLDTIVTGTRRTLEFAREAGARRVLLLSSGLIYGKQPSELTHVDEEFTGGPAPTDPSVAYAEGKRLAEQMGVLYGRQYGLEVVIARCFAFLGPYLPLDRHFAAGNFLRDALAGGPIRIGGDGTPFRSYLYAAELVVWLLTLLMRGEPGRAYNVGAERAVTIAELAGAIAAALAPSPAVTIATPPRAGVPASRYVPSTARARRELGLEESVTLEDAIARTLRFHHARLRTEGP